MSTVKPVRYQINKSPGKTDLMLGLFDHNGSKPRKVRFELEGKPTWSNYLVEVGGKIFLRYIDVGLLGVARESDRWDKWLFKGHTELLKIPVRGCVNTHDRKGWIEFGPADPQVHEHSFSSIFGYGLALSVNGGIICFIADESSGKGDLTKGQTVAIQGDSRGYVPSGLKPGLGKIIGFCKPNERGNPDHIVHVKDHSGNIGWIKPSNIV